MFLCRLVLVFVAHIFQGYFTNIMIIISCHSTIEATLMNMGKYIAWIH